MTDLKDRVAIITGAASGIGEATAHRFVEEGAAVVVSDIDEVGIGRVVDALRAKGGKAEGFRLDVAQRERMPACYDAAIEAFGKLDILVNNAALASSHGLDPGDEWDNGLAVSLSSVYWMSKSAIPHLQDRGGAIVNVASIAGNGVGMPIGWYCAAKAGVVGVTRSFATTYGRKGIRTNAICPGLTHTPRTSVLLDKSPETARVHNDRSPLGRYGLPAEQASVIYFLASDDASYVNGQAIFVDGGFTLVT